MTQVIILTSSLLVGMGVMFFGGLWLARPWLDRKLREDKEKCMSEWEERRRRLYPENEKEEVGV